MFWGLREVRGNGALNSVADAVNSINSGAGTIADGTAPVIDHSDPDNRGGQGLFRPDRHDFIGNMAGADDEDVAAIFKGTIRVEPGQAGLHSFGSHSDDGFALRFPGQSWLSASGNGEIDPASSDTLQHFGNTGDSNTRGVIDLPAGDHPVEYIAYERGGGAYWELYSAPGSHVNDADTTDWRLVGHKAGGDIVNVGVTSAGWSVATTPTNQGTLNTLADAVNAFNAATGAGTLIAGMHPQVNFGDPQSGAGNGDFDPDIPFDNDTAADDNDFAMLATAILDVPVDGRYQFGFRGDDGGEFGFFDTSIAINAITTNETGLSAIGEGVFGGGGMNAVTCDCLTGNSLTIFDVDLTAGQHDIYAAFWERGGGAYFEVFGGGPNAPLQLLAADGSMVMPDFDGLQLVPEPGTGVLAAIGLFGLASVRRRRR